MRILVLCTHNSARSQMAEGWLREFAKEAGLAAEICSAGTEKSTVKPEAVQVMREVGIDLSAHTSKRLDELPDPCNFDVVLTVCDSANEACPNYPEATLRLHAGHPDPTGRELSDWRKVRDDLKRMSRELVDALARGEAPTRQALTALE